MDGFPPEHLLTVTSFPLSPLTPIVFLDSAAKHCQDIRVSVTGEGPTLVSPVVSCCHVFPHVILWALAFPRGDGRGDEGIETGQGHGNS